MVSLVRLDGPRVTTSAQCPLLNDLDQDLEHRGLRFAPATLLTLSFCPFSVPLLLGSPFLSFPFFQPLIPFLNQAFTSSNALRRSSPYSLYCASLRLAFLLVYILIEKWN
jgi:hypothetical protein